MVTNIPSQIKCVATLPCEIVFLHKLQCSTIKWSQPPYKYSVPQNTNVCISKSSVKYFTGSCVKCTAWGVLAI